MLLCLSEIAWCSFDSSQRGIHCFLDCGDLDSLDSSNHDYLLPLLRGLSMCMLLRGVLESKSRRYDAKLVR